MVKNYFNTRSGCPSCKSLLTSEIYNCDYQSSPIKNFLNSFYQGNIDFQFLDNASFILEECRKCGTVFQKEIPDNDLMKKLYEEWVIGDSTLGDNSMQVYLYYAQEILSVIAYLKKQTSSELKVLDFGMGWGKWCSMALAFGCDAYGTELSQSKILYARSQGVKVISWDEISNYSFDFINTEQVLEHISEPLEVLKHLVKSLKPGGLLKISVPNGNHIKKRLKNEDWMAPKDSKYSLNAVSPLEHINCFNHSSILAMADSVGLELVKLPISLQLAYILDLSSLKKIIKYFVRPFYRNFLTYKITYLFFQLKKN